MTTPSGKAILKATVYYLGRYELKEGEPFSLAYAHELIDMFTTKGEKRVIKQKTKMKAYRNGLALGRPSMFTDSPIHQFYHYKDLLRFFVFKADPRILILGVQEGQKKFYVVFRFRNLKKLNTVCDYIERSKKSRDSTVEPIIIHPDAEDVLEEYVKVETFKNVELTPSGNMQEVASTETQEFHIQEEPVKQAEVAEEMVVIHVVKHPESSAEVSEKQTEVVVVSVEESAKPASPPKEHVPNGSNHLIRETETCEFVFRHQSIEEDPMKTVLLRTTASEDVPDDQWAIDIKYITYDPKIGSRITETGPVYMYTAHHMIPEHRGYSACSSSSGSTTTSPASSRSNSFYNDHDHHRSASPINGDSLPQDLPVGLRLSAYN